MFNNNIPASIRFIAFFLPQFHPTKENDLWWGKGFTEWTNVTKAAPLFNGHYQPHLPTESGFYDLRLKETRLDQIEMAKAHGIDGFCYHYYWFSGTKILNQPVDAMLADNEHDMPFCLCWANENWTRQWDAAEHEILIAQKYQPEDDLNFIKSLVPFFSDSRYIRHEGKPFFIVYRPQHLPDSKKSIGIWREHCREVGIGEIHVCCALTHGNLDHKLYGFDSGVEFPPHNLAGIDSTVDPAQLDFYGEFTGTVVQFASVAHLFLNRSYPGSDVFKGVFPSWDNTARRGARAFVVLNGTPGNYEYWLKETVALTAMENPGKERFIFINAWNEWAEGCHLEPDRVYGRQFLDATLRVKQGVSEATEFPDVQLPAGDGGFFLNLLASSATFSPSLVSFRCFWLQHLPFLHWLVSTQKPATLAFVNVDTGNAFHNAGRAALDNSSASLCCGSIRTDQTPVFRSLTQSPAAGCDLFVSDETKFLDRFNDASLDLIVLDDFVSEDQLDRVFSAALRKASPRCIIVVHDIFVADSPCFAFWDRIKSDFRSFTFPKSHGLGVLLVGSDIPGHIERLVDADVSNRDWDISRRLFALMGEKVEEMALRSESEELLENARNDIDTLKREIMSVRQEVESITQSSSWRMTEPVRKLLEKIKR
jgi:hypothetical protein